jgi:hypothetical protein
LKRLLSDNGEIGRVDPVRCVYVAEQDAHDWADDVAHVIGVEHVEEFDGEILRIKHAR